MRKTVPTSCGVPSGSRKSAAVAGMSSNHGTAACVWSKNVWSTTKPFARDADARLQRLGERDRAVLLERVRHVASVPGTPTDIPLQRASLNGSGAPFSQNEVGVIAAGAVSRPSIVVTFPSAVRMTMNPPPPMPHENGSVTPSTPAAMTAASMALPPAFSSSIAACVASRSTLAAAPPVPVDVGGPDGATSAEALTAEHECDGDRRRKGPHATCPSKSHKNGLPARRPAQT